MARVQKKVARKDYPQYGIVKGDTYYKVSLKTGPRSSKTLRSKTPFKRSQLTSSEFLQQAYEIADERLEAITSPDDLQSLKDDVEQLKSDQEEKLENMPEGLREGPTGQMIQERIDQCQEFLDSLDGVDFEEEENFEPSDDVATYEDYVASIVQEIQSFCPF